MGMERRGKQSISLSRSRIAEMTTSAVTNRVKGCLLYTSLVERTIALVNAFGAGTAVFMVEGLQLIIAILLMVLGVIIVYTSGKELFQKKAELKHSNEEKLA